jgi:flagellar hook-associated protein 3 FlgL
MRISSKMMNRQFLGNLDNLYNTMSKQHTQVSTGKAFQSASEDPVNAVKSMDINSEIKKTEQYEKYIGDAESMLNEQEVALSGISDALVEIQEVLQQALNGTYNDNDKKSLAEVVDSVKDNIVSLLNKDYGGKYIFGGWNTSTAPVVNDSETYTYNGTSITGMTAEEANDFQSQEFKYRTGNGTDVDVAMSVLEITGSGGDNLLSLLDNISNELKNPPSDNEKLNEYFGQTNDFFDDINVKRSKVGAKMSGMDLLRNQNIEGRTSLMNLLSRVEDIDIEQAMIDFKTTEMVYNAALSVGAKIIQPSLADFLK